MELYDHELTDEEYVQFMEEQLFPRQSLLNFADGVDLAAVPDNPITKAILDYRHVLIHFQDSPFADGVDLAAVPDNPITKAILDFRRLIG